MVTGKLIKDDLSLIKGIRCLKIWALMPRKKHMSGVNESQRMIKDITIKSKLTPIIPIYIHVLLMVWLRFKLKNSNFHLI